MLIWRLVALLAVHVHDYHLCSQQVSQVLGDNNAIGCSADSALRQAALAVNPPMVWLVTHVHVMDQAYDALGWGPNLMHRLKVELVTCIPSQS